MTARDSQERLTTQAATSTILGRVSRGIARTATLRGAAVSLVVGIYLTGLGGIVLWSRSSSSPISTSAPPDESESGFPTSTESQELDDLVNFLAKNGANVSYRGDLSAGGSGMHERFGLDRA